MKIAISSHPTTGGSGVVASELAMALAKKGHQVHLVACARPLRLGEVEGLTYHHFEVNDYPLFRFPPHDLCLTNKLSEVVRSHEIDIIHAHYAIPHAVTAHLAKNICLPWQTRVITTLHGTDVTLVGSDPGFLRLTQYAMEQSDGLTAVSSWLRSKTMEFFKLSRPPVVIPNFIDAEQFNENGRSGYPRGGPFELLHISNFRPVKRICDVIRTFSLVRERLPARLTLLGEGPETGLAREFVSELGLTEHVTFKNVSKSLAPVYRKSHLFFLLSDYESFGVSALEALACGVPVIASGAGGLPEVIDSGKTGLLCKVGDIDGAAEKALHILEDRVRWEEMSREAALTSKRRFGSGQVVERYEKYYREISES